MVYDSVDKNGAALVGVVTGCLGLLWAIFLFIGVLKKNKGNDKMQEIALAIQEGSAAFLKAEYQYISVFVVIVFIILGVAVDWETAACFVVGAVVSGLTGIIGMSVAVRSNVRTAAAAQDDLNSALRVAFNSGAVMGFTVVSLALVALGLTYLAVDEDTSRLAGFGMGASAIALFARVGGGIYTKAADVGADLVGKVEAGIPEDDPRNPGVIADNVGDNVGDVAGMGADLFESYVGSIIAAAAIGLDEFEGSNGVALPIWVASAGIIASILGSLCVRTKEGASQSDLLFSMRLGTLVASVLIIGASIAVVELLDFGYEYFGCVVIGLIAGVLIGFFTEYATSFAYWPVLSIAEAGRTGPATVIIQGLAVGMWSAVPPIVVICIAILACYTLGGVYGIAIAPVGMLSTLGVTLATDAYGPVADNAGGIAEMAEMPSHVRDRTDALDALGNTTAATGKGFAIGSAVLTALALLTAFAQEVGLRSQRVDLIDDVEVLPGILFGAMLPFLFASLTMTAVGKAAGKIISEVRRQFHEIPGLLEGRSDAKADYAACVAIATTSSLQQMVLPGVIAVAAPCIIGIGFGRKALAGLLAGGIASGSLLAISMANAGGAWDNAKKFCEAGHFGGKRSEVHKALVTGDTVGDPFKDTSGPSLNILLKLMAIVSLVLSPVFKDPEYWVAIIIFVLVVVLAAGLQYVFSKQDEGDVYAPSRPSTGNKSGYQNVANDA